MIIKKYSIIIIFIAVIYTNLLYIISIISLRRYQFFVGINIEEIAVLNIRLYSIGQN